MSLVDDLKAAKALIDTPEKWEKGEPLPPGCNCAWTACVVAEIGGAMDDVVDALLTFVPPSDDDHGYRALIRYNDAPATTHADIMALFDRAINAAEHPTPSLNEIEHEGDAT